MYDSIFFSVAAVSNIYVAIYMIFNFIRNTIPVYEHTLPYGDRLEYLDFNPANRRRRRKGNPVPRNT
jgi:hypothetical protein